MKTTLKPHPAMKDSGVPWLGEVPKHWAVQRMKTLLRQRSEKGFPDEPLLAATQTKGVVRKEQYENRTVLALKDLHLLKLVRVGDFVISLRSFQGGIEYARERGIISPAYTILYPHDQTIHGYLAWIFKSKPFIEGLSLFVTGIRQGQNIDYERLSRSSLPLPPPDEQAAIVRFLDHTDRQIRRYIRAKQKLIKLLEEQKQAIIHRAVTRGLDPNVRLKPSGVEWLGEVPEHWEVVTLRRVIRRAVDGPHHSPSYVDDGIPFLSARNIKADRWSLDDAKFISEEDYAEFSKRVIPEVGDVLYTKGGTTGVARAVDLPFKFQVWVHVAVLKPNRRKIVPEFLAMILNAPRSYEQAQLLTRGATNQDLGLGRMKDIVFALPPHDEQGRILEAVRARTAYNARAIEGARNEIALLREYRTRLIADVVTGKLDVREAAARLPDEADEPEPLDEADAVADSDEADTDDDAVDDALLQEVEA
jgi:type I restriction enzyme S subunit